MNRYLIVLLLSLFPFAKAIAETETEIQYLLSFIEGSGCTFERNDTYYSAAEARSHIQNKYDYAKRWILTTEDFIQYTATKSSISGKPYYVLCQDERQPSAQWLMAELERYRSETAAKLPKH